ncbi:male-enhanced antigen 1 isoform X2 [Belonocnema kinseyi]|nr:male-enhanced antigen 1 isoform X2 [Belonocnema kinseyi]XP_033226432.1 male-enhanced antigen 1 isoform X2 [Belonocnema kinseyi]XP_033226433.1 male-enhanced antigen 1 isoform X2 [Belonocnema kinseyi]
MSPEPKQDVDENWNATNLNAGLRVASDSESEDEDHAADGYMPLSQEPVDGDLLLDEEEDEEWIATPVNPPHIVPESTSEQIQITSETVQVWSSSCNRSNIDLDADKIDQVKHVMASFLLPNTAIPEWANTVTEEQWKEQLIGRIKEMQSK